MGIINSKAETAFKKCFWNLASGIQLYNQNTKGVHVFCINMNVCLTCEQKREGLFLAFKTIRKNDFWMTV